MLLEKYTKNVKGKSIIFGKDEAFLLPHIIRLYKKNVFYANLYVSNVKHKTIMPKWAELQQEFSASEALTATLLTPQQLQPVYSGRFASPVAWKTRAPLWLGFP